MIDLSKSSVAHRAIMSGPYGALVAKRDTARLAFVAAGEARSRHDTDTNRANYTVARTIYRASMDELAQARAELGMR